MSYEVPEDWGEILKSARKLIRTEYKEIERTKQEACETFANHTLDILMNTETVQVFELRKGTSDIFAVKVYCADNLIMLTGDISDVVIHPGYRRQGVAWMRDAIESRGYFREKYSQATLMEQKEFCLTTVADGIFCNFDGDDLEGTPWELLENCVNGYYECEDEYYSASHGQYDIDEPHHPTIPLSHQPNSGTATTRLKNYARY